METRVLTLFDDEEFFKPEPPREKPKKEKAEKPAAKTEQEAEDIIPDTPLTESILPELQSELDAEDLVAEPQPLTDTETELTTDENKSWADADLPLVELALAEQVLEPGQVNLPSINENDDNPVQAEEVSEEQPEDEGTATIPQPEAHEITPEMTATETTFVPDTQTENTTEEEVVNEDSLPEQEIPEQEQDKALNQQILSELIQLDYTALLQKNYSIDVETATIAPQVKEAETKEEIATDKEEIMEEDFVFEEVTPLPEWKLDKKYYTIGEVAQLFEVNTSHIRFWTNEFKLKPRTNRKGDRLYNPKDIAELRLIHHLVKVKKHTIKGAREKLKSEKTGVNNKLDLKESLIDLKESLMRIREQL